MIIALSVSGATAYFYGEYEQNNAYQQWIADSKEQNKNSPVTDNSLDALRITESGSTTGILQTETAQQKVKVPRPRENQYIRFIRNYYSNLANGKIDDAYSVSKKSVSLETYRGWYVNVSSIIIDDIQEIEEKKYSLSLTLTEGNVRTRYGVLMSLGENTSGILSVASSEVRVLSKIAVNPANIKKVKASVPVAKVESPENASNNDSFFDANRNLLLEIDNPEFQEILNKGQSPYVLDAREDEEFEIGKFPGSEHIRFADLLAGEWISLPTNKIVYVFCWSGIRGKEVAEFLRSKKIVSRFIITGADGWVSFGGLWKGGINFTSAYTDSRYTRLFNLDELKQKISDGVIIIDSRMNSKYEYWHIPESVNIPIIYTPTSRMEETLSQVPDGKQVITVCDDFVSCFDAKITGLKLGRKGHEFLGRYNKPWEYRSSQQTP